MNTRILPCLAIAAALLSGCGGSAPGGQSAPKVPSASLAAVGPESAYGSTPHGFDESGRPVFAVSNRAGSTWTVSSAEGAPLYDVRIEGVIGSTPEEVSGRYVVGSYEVTGGSGPNFGLIVSANDSGTVSQRRFPGSVLYDVDGPRALVRDEGAAGRPFYVLDLATGTLAAAPVPPGASPVAMRGRYALCSTGRGRSAASGPTRAPGGMVLLNVETGASVALQAPEGTDGTVFAAALNSKGESLGVTHEGNVTQLRLWNASGEPGAVLDAVAQPATGEGTYIEAGWLSEDSSRMVYGKYVGDSSECVMRVGGLAYRLDTGAFPIQALRDLNPAATAGFAYDPVRARDVAVSISYR